MCRLCLSQSSVLIIDTQTFFCSKRLCMCLHSHRHVHYKQLQLMQRTRSGELIQSQSRAGIAHTHTHTCMHTCIQTSIYTFSYAICMYKHTPVSILTITIINRCKNHCRTKASPKYLPLCLCLFPVSSGLPPDTSANLTLLYESVPGLTFISV